MDRDGSTTVQGAWHGRDGRQRIRVTVPLAGPQEPLVAGSRPGPEAEHGEVGLLLGRVMLVFYDRPAVDTLVKAWSDQAAKAERLPSDAERSTPRASARTGGDPPILVDARGSAPVSAQLVRPYGHTPWLQLQYGGVLFSVRDTAAFETTNAAIRKVAEIAREVMVSAEPPAAPSRTAASVSAALAAPPPALPSSLRGGARTAPARPPTPRPGPGATPGIASRG
jgi:hypothetical protein